MERRKDAKRSVARSVELDWKGGWGNGDLRWSLSLLLGVWVVGYSTGRVDLDTQWYICDV
jgi:hypothetical protein